MLFLSGLVLVVVSRMHRNGFGFTGQRTGTQNVVPVSSAFNCDEFACCCSPAPARETGVEASLSLAKAHIARWLSFKSIHYLKSIFILLVMQI